MSKLVSTNSHSVLSFELKELHMAKVFTLLVMPRTLVRVNILLLILKVIATFTTLEFWSEITQKAHQV